MKIESATEASGAGSRRTTPSRRTTRTIAFVFVLALGGCAWFSPGRPAPPVSAPSPVPTPTATPLAERMKFEATAYSVRGTTASGERARQGVVAADPKILPLGSRIRVHGAGAYSGEYEVEDTGRTIRGTEIDIFVLDVNEARRFGRKQVEVEILRRGAK